MIGTRCEDVLGVCTDLPGTVIFVTNEVGMGIVPEIPVPGCSGILQGGAISAWRIRQMFLFS